MTLWQKRFTIQQTRQPQQHPSGRCTNEMVRERCSVTTRHGKSPPQLSWTAEKRRAEPHENEACRSEVEHGSVNYKRKPKVHDRLPVWKPRRNSGVCAQKLHGLAAHDFRT